MVPAGTGTPISRRIRDKAFPFSGFSNQPSPDKGGEAAFVQILGRVPLGLAACTLQCEKPRP